MKKPKLLITLGCSFTEGVGCYDPQTLINNKGDVESLSTIYAKNKERFHEYSWPSLLQKMLNYDELINLGLGGASTSGNLKVFFEKYKDIDFSEKYDVLIIWFVPHSTRFSFYRNGHVVNIIPTMDHNIYNRYTYKLGLEYVNFIGNLSLDPTLDQLFYIKVMEDHCKLKNYNFLFTLTDPLSESLYNKLYDGKCMMLNGKSPLPNVYENPHLKSLACDHPNEKGYEIVAQTFFNWIQEYRKDLLSNEIPTRFISKWDGNELNKHTKNHEII